MFQSKNHALSPILRFTISCARLLNVKDIFAYEPHAQITLSHCLIMDTDEMSLSSLPPPSRLCSTIEVLDEVSALVREVRSRSRTATVRKGNNTNSASAGLPPLFSPDELPPYLGTWHPILPSPRLSAVLREKEEEAERKDRDRKFLQGSLWKVPLKNQRFTGAVRKVADQWNFFWHPQTCSFSQTPHNQDNKMKLLLSARREKGPYGPSYSIFSVVGLESNVGSGNLVGKLEVEAKRRRFSLFDNGMDFNELLTSRAAINTTRRLTTRTQLATLLIKRGVRGGGLWNRAQAKNLLLLLPYALSPAETMEAKEKGKLGSTIFSQPAWNDLRPLVWETFVGEMSRQERKFWIVQPQHKEKDIMQHSEIPKDPEKTGRESVPGKHSEAPGGGGFLFQMNLVRGRIGEKGAEDHYEVEFGSPLSCTHAFALALAAIHTNFK